MTTSKADDGGVPGERAAIGHLVGTEARDVADDDAAHVQHSRGAEYRLEVAGEHAFLESEAAVVHGGEGLVDRVDGLDVTGDTVCLAGA
jgi:hypothetical protein